MTEVVSFLGERFLFLTGPRKRVYFLPVKSEIGGDVKDKMDSLCIFSFVFLVFVIPNPEVFVSNLYYFSLFPHASIGSDKI